METNETLKRNAEHVAKSAFQKSQIHSPTLVLGSSVSSEQRTEKAKKPKKGKKVKKKLSKMEEFLQTIDEQYNELEKERKQAGNLRDANKKLEEAKQPEKTFLEKRKETAQKNIPKDKEMKNSKKSLKTPKSSKNSAQFSVKSPETKPRKLKKKISSKTPKPQKKEKKSFRMSKTPAPKRKRVKSLFTPKAQTPNFGLKFGRTPKAAMTPKFGRFQKTPSTAKPKFAMKFDRTPKSMRTPKFENTPRRIKTPKSMLTPKFDKTPKSMRTPKFDRTPKPMRTPMSEIGMKRFAFMKSPPLNKAKSSKVRVPKSVKKVHMKEAVEEIDDSLHQMKDILSPRQMKKTKKKKKKKKMKEPAEEQKQSPIEMKKPKGLQFANVEKLLKKTQIKKEVNAEANLKDAELAEGTEKNLITAEMQSEVSQVEEINVKLEITQVPGELKKKEAALQSQPLIKVPEVASNDLKTSEKKESDVALQAKILKKEQKEMKSLEVGEEAMKVKRSDKKKLKEDPINLQVKTEQPVSMKMKKSEKKKLNITQEMTNDESSRIYMSLVNVEDEKKESDVALQTKILKKEQKEMKSLEVGEEAMKVKRSDKKKLKEDPAKLQVKTEQPVSMKMKKSEKNKLNITQEMTNDESSRIYLGPVNIEDESVQMTKPAKRKQRISKKMKMNEIANNIASAQKKLRLKSSMEVSKDESMKSKNTEKKKQLAVENDKNMKKMNKSKAGNIRVEKTKVVRTEKDPKSKSKRSVAPAAVKTAPVKSKKKQSKPEKEKIKIGSKESKSEKENQKLVSEVDEESSDTNFKAGTIEVLIEKAKKSVVVMDGYINEINSEMNSQANEWRRDLMAEIEESHDISNNVLSVGDKCILCHLKDKEMNGKCAVLRKWRPEKEKWTLQCIGEEQTYNIKGKCLKLLNDSDYLKRIVLPQFLAMPYCKRILEKVSTLSQDAKSTIVKMIGDLFWEMGFIFKTNTKVLITTEQEQAIAEALKHRITPDTFMELDVKAHVQEELIRALPQMKEQMEVAAEMRIQLESTMESKASKSPGPKEIFKEEKEVVQAAACCMKFW